ncbi:putative dithiol-disulfide oxidoreductase (DUF899 family) [Streptomyces sp. 3330]|uniref:DUF899 domain-containing protein n=1 Tax=Streptomyces sp. 3330 TaxID=2817755 RepID=UPI00285C56FF|nr:DUF899 domain-containing protein [Streptomyces sp. 3330]MDR6978239.1 putative dithiol-disulfide oxidoreductase (DUF899 family) [Streptomyces sp. 3330]
MAHPELPEIVSREEWRAAREELLVKEEAVTRAREALGAERRALPMVEVAEEYVFEGGDGKAGLLDLFDGRRQLVVHHFMFAPEWQTGCRCCAAFLDQVGHLAHLHAYGTSFAVVSRAPFTRILPFKARMGWTVPWYSSYDDDFNGDFGATVGEPGGFAERPGVSCFLREGDRVFHTYSMFDGELDRLGPAMTFLDLTALGPPSGVRLRYHDEYDF